MLSSTYWPAWKASVQEGKAKGVMCSYNALNGARPVPVPCCAMVVCCWVALPGVASRRVAYTGTRHQLRAIYDLDMKSVLKLTTRPLVACCWHLRRATRAGVPTCADARLTQQTAILLRNPLLNKSSPPQQEAAEEEEAEEAHAYTNAHGGLAVLPFKKGLKVAVIGPHGNATKVRVEKQERRLPSFCLFSVSDDGDQQTMISPLAPYSQQGQVIIHACPLTGEASGKPFAGERWQRALGQYAKS